MFPFCDPELEPDMFVHHLRAQASLAQPLLFPSTSRQPVFFSYITLKSALSFMPLDELLLQVVYLPLMLRAAKDRGSSHPQCLE